MFEPFLAEKTYPAANPDAFLCQKGLRNGLKTINKGESKPT